MSRLYIKDLERIVNGKIERFSLGVGPASSLVSLDKIDKERKEARGLRDLMIEEFKNDINNELEINRGSRIEPNETISFNPERLFNYDYLDMSIPTILGDTHCLFSDVGIVASTSDMSDLDIKVKLIMPYVKKLFELKKYTHLLDNDFYNDLNIFDEEERVLVLHGGGVFLPFNDYKDLTEEKLQELLTYYYIHWDKLLKNILVTNNDILNRYKPDITKEKILEIYKGSK